MFSYLAHDKKSGLIVSGGFNQVIEWSRQRIANKSSKAIIAIIKCRPLSDGRVVAEFTQNGSRTINQGRVIPWSEVLKLAKRAADG